MIKLKQIINEGKYNFRISNAVKSIMNSIRNKKKDGKIILVINEKNIPLYFYNYYLSPFDIKQGPYKTRTDANLIYTLSLDIKNPFAIAANSDEDDIEIHIVINKSMIPLIYNDLVAELKDGIRHELEHVTQYNMEVKPKPKDLISMMKKSNAYYLMSACEVPAFVAGFYIKSKTKKSSIDTEMNNYLLDMLEYGQINKQEYKKIKKKWFDYCKIHYPHAKWENYD